MKKLHDDLDVASNTVKVLRDMLKEVDVVTNPEALDDPTIDELSEQCRQMRPRRLAGAERRRRVADDQGAGLNDELSEVAEKRDALRAAASADRDTRAAIVASMREEEEAAARGHASASDDASAKTAPVSDLVDLLGGVSVDPGADVRPGKDKAAPGRAMADPFGPAADAPVDPFDVSVTVGDGGGNRGKKPGGSDPLDELLAPPPPPPAQVYDPFAASASVAPASAPPAGGSQPANYYPTVAGTAGTGGATSDPFATANPFASRQPGRRQWAP